MSTFRIPLTAELQSRAGLLGADSRTCNVVFEDSAGQTVIVKRPGAAYATSVVNLVSPNFLQAQGLYSWQGQAISIIAGTVYRTVFPPPSYSNIGIGTISASTSQTYGIKTYLDGSLFFHNKINGYLLSAGFGLTSPLSIPAGPFVSGVVYLDNYIFLGIAGNNRIYNSNLADATTWGALNYISFEQTSDILVGIAKHLNYLVAFGKYSMQFFYDAGNASGSPLAVAPSYTQEIGCANGDSIVATDNLLIWVGLTKTNGKSVYLMDGTTESLISTPDISRMLELDGLSRVSAYAYKFSGHNMYLLYLATSKITLAYDITTKKWHQWSMYALASSDQPNPNTNYESYYRPTFFAEVNGAYWGLDDHFATLYTIKMSSTSDGTSPIYARVVTPLMDHQSTKRKFYASTQYIGDKTVGGILQVRYTNTDYTTFSTFRNLDMGTNRPQIYNCGAGRRRAWEFLCTTDTPFRMQAVEIEVRIGEMGQEQGT